MGQLPFNRVLKRIKSGAYRLNSVQREDLARLFEAEREVKRVLIRSRNYPRNIKFGMVAGAQNRVKVALRHLTFSAAPIIAFAVRF